MSLASDCGCPCPTSEIVEVPGTTGEKGDPGTNGSDGVNAFTVTTGNFTVPAIGSNVTVLVADSTWAVVGQNVFVFGAGYFSVASKPASTSLELTYLNYVGNTNTGNSITSGAGVSPAGTQPAVAGVNALTNNTTGVASDTLAAGVGVFTLAFTIQLASMTTAAADLVTNYIPGFAFKILAFAFATTTLGTGTSASQVLNMEIGTTNLTGGLLTLTLAGTTPLGALTSATAITAANVGTSTDSFSIEVAAGGTVFTAGEGVLLVKIQNMDSANSVASLATHINDILTDLA